MSFNLEGLQKEFRRFQACGSEKRNLRKIDFVTMKNLQESISEMRRLIPIQTPSIEKNDGKK